MENKLFEESCPDCGSINVSAKYMVSRDGFDVYEYACRDCGCFWEAWESGDEEDLYEDDSISS